MSRIIIKNLPKNITEEKLRNQFSQKGTITDVQLKYTNDGVFRKFAFIGYSSNEEANEAIKYFNNACIQTSRIKVETCAALGSDSKPMSWSKYSKDSVAYRKNHGIFELERQEKEEKFLENKKKKISKIDEILGVHKDDPEFIEYMKAHDKNRIVWANDADVLNNNQKNETVDEIVIENVKFKESVPDDNIKFAKHNKDIDNVEDDQDNENEVEDEENENEAEDEENEKVANKNISDLEYMKQLMKKCPETESKSKIKKPLIDLFTIKIRDIPYTTKRQDILKFFKPIKPNSIRLPAKVRGFCYVGFTKENDFKKAMLKDKSFIKGKQVFFFDFTEKNKAIINKNKVNDDLAKYDDASKKSKWTKQEDSLKNEEDISESGKIFFRNLSYTTCEDNLRTLFSKYGELADISLPIDPITRKIKGFGTVTFVMPEHALHAFNELDGTTFQGRLLHLIPGKSKDHEEDNENDEGLSFKAKKAKNLKKSAGQTHSWNSLFMGSNAVANILAKKYETEKEIILDTNTGGSSAAVRLALGETEIVMELKKFLEENDVQLSAFDSTNSKRSTTIMLAKNLQADTTVSELKDIFSKFGLIGRIVLPPSGVTALIEYMDPSEAKKAFRKLAYSKFKNLPLYLEWAPDNTFKNPVKYNPTVSSGEENKVDEEISNKTENEKVKKEQSEEADNNDDDDDIEPENNTTLFLKNLNFHTREDTVRNHFKHLGPIHIAQVARRKDPENPRNIISLGYGFIQFKKNETLEKALKTMQHTKIEGNQIELKRSDRTLKLDSKSIKKLAELKQQTGTKILVRNIPFQAKTKEVYELFKAFGELRSVRLPKKMDPGETTHRGFGFVDFITKSDAKKAFQTLCNSTHLYGRRLVLEWASNNDSDVKEIRKRIADSFQKSGGPVKQFRKANFDENRIEENDE